MAAKFLAAFSGKLITTFPSCGMVLFSLNKKPFPLGNGLPGFGSWFVCRFPTLALPRSGSAGLISG